jgi:hypothetical protein
VSGLNNFCTIEPSPLPEYDYLVRFRGAAGNIIVTVRIKDVEQVFCTLNGGIGFADVRGGSLDFIPVSQELVGFVNGLVAAMIR